MVSNDQRSFDTITLSMEDWKYGRLEVEIEEVKSEHKYERSKRMIEYEC